MANRDGWPEQLVPWAPNLDRVSADRSTGTPTPRACRLYLCLEWVPGKQSDREETKKKTFVGWFVGWFVGRITERLLGRFSQNMDGGWALARKRPL